MAGEAYTKIRYDRRVSPRRDATAALMIFGLIEDNPATFAIRTPNLDDHIRAVSVLREYHDQGFSYVDAACFAEIDSDPEIGRVLTVDGRDFRTYRFAHPVDVVLPNT